MNATRREDSTILCEVTEAELKMLMAALREVAGGVEIPEFETRLGFSRSAIQALALNLRSILDQLDIHE